MKLELPKDWYEKRIALEGDAEIGAGAPPPFVRRGPRSKELYRQPSKKAGQRAADEHQAKPTGTRMAFGTFVELWRRDRGWDAARLAREAGVDPEQVLEIERDLQFHAEPGDVRKLAALFRVPAQALLELTGQAETQTLCLRDAGVPFAVKRETTGPLNQYEKAALDAFIAAIADAARD